MPSNGRPRRGDPHIVTPGPARILARPGPNLVWVVVALMWLTWSPFELGGPGGLVRLGFRRITLETVANVLLLIPLAVNVSEWIRTSGGGGRKTVRAVLIIAGAAAAIEIGQLFVSARVTSLADWVLNTVGGGVAAALWLHWSAGAESRTRALAPLTGILLAPVLLLNAQILTALPAALAPLNWSADAALAIGEEVGGERRLLGFVDDASVCTEGPAGMRCLLPGDSREATSEFNEMVRRNDHVRVEARVTSEHDQQSGPARIVTYAEGIARRNVTLALEGRDLLFRMRTPFTGPNGVFPEFVLRNAVPASMPVRVSAVYDNGRITLQSTGDAGSRSWRLRPSLIASSWIWTRARQLTGPAEFLRMVFGAGALFLPLGLIVGAMHRPGRWRHGLALVTVGALAPLGAAAAGVPLRPAEIAVSLLAYAAGVASSAQGRPKETAGGGPGP